MPDPSLNQAPDDGPDPDVLDDKLEDMMQSCLGANGGGDPFAAEDKKKEKEKEKDGKKRKTLDPGTIIDAMTRRYEVISLLGSGGFGDVYLIENYATKQRSAMKTEIFGGNVLMERLKLEVIVLEECTNAKRRTHFLTCVDKGKTNDFKFMIMDLIGKCIDDLRKKVMCCNFSKSTALQLALQTLEAVEDLHDLGWIHRDIKGQNFAVGPNKQETIVYMLDFGIARKYKDANGSLNKPRKQTKFLGTLRWASRALHKGEDQGRKDDLETWLYMVVDFFDDNALPWGHLRERKAIFVGKDLLMRECCPESFTHCPPGIAQVIRHLNGLKFQDEPSYGVIKEHLMLSQSDKHFDVSLPLDWIGCVKAIQMKGGDKDAKPPDEPRAFVPHHERHRPLRPSKLSEAEKEAFKTRFDKALATAMEQDRQAELKAQGNGVQRLQKMIRKKTTRGGKEGTVEEADPPTLDSTRASNRAKKSPSNHSIKPRIFRTKGFLRKDTTESTVEEKEAGCPTAMSPVIQSPTTHANGPPSVRRKRTEKK